MPWVMTWCGTCSMSPSKNRALSIRVCSVSVLIRVREASDEHGSLNPMCPSVPMPSNCRSTPPASVSALSYVSHAPATSSAVPSGPMNASMPSPNGSSTSRRSTER